MEWRPNYAFSRAKLAGERAFDNDRFVCMPSSTPVRERGAFPLLRCRVWRVRGWVEPQRGRFSNSAWRRHFSNKSLSERLNLSIRDHLTSSPREEALEGERRCGLRPQDGFGERKQPGRGATTPESVRKVISCESRRDFRTVALQRFDCVRIVVLGDEKNTSHTRISTD